MFAAPSVCMTPLKELLNIDQPEDGTESPVHKDTDDALETDKVLLRSVARLPSDIELTGALSFPQLVQCCFAKAVRESFLFYSFLAKLVNR